MRCLMLIPFNFKPVRFDKRSDMLSGLIWIQTVWHSLIIFPNSLEIDQTEHYTLTVLSDFINLTQVHNFTVSAQDIFTFRRLSVFTASITGISQVVMQIMKRFVPSY